MSVNKNHIDLDTQVIKTLVYFDIFNYPLKAVEIFKFLGVRSDSPAEVTECLNRLTEKRHVFRFQDLYALHPDERSIQRRIKGNIEASKWLHIARKQARFIGSFPFIRGVMASGSLSKGYMDEQSDLDFFIVTAPNRLWIARTLLVLYKRIFLKNSHKQFCINYFVDQTHLEIEEKNLFTATELATLVPLYEHPCYESVLASNRWVNAYFPNFKTGLPTQSDRQKVQPGKIICELLLYPLSAFIDGYLMRLSLRRWRKLYADRFSKEDFEIAFKTRQHVSKNHPNHYQKKILEKYQAKLLEFESRLTQLTIL